MKVGAGEGPVEGGRGPVVAVLEGQDAVGEGVEIGEVDRADGFALQDREVEGEQLAIERARRDVR